MGRYVEPGELVRLHDGRRLHLKCLGRGAPTIVLTAGLGEWSATWRRVQPALAQRTQVCAWDRAGIGFSDGSTARQTIAATTADLEEGLRRVGLRGPYLLIGHSLGRYETLRFADRHPDAVRGMVLVDPTIPDKLARFAKAGPAFARLLEDQTGQRTAFLRTCATAIGAGRIAPGGQDPDGCFAFPDDYPRRLAETLARLDQHKARWDANISLADSFADDTRAIVNPRRDYAAMPLIVLSSTALPAFPPGTPAVVRADAPKVLAELWRGHAELARLSTRGVARRVEGSGHYIQIDRPAAVIAAVETVLDGVQAERRAPSTGRLTLTPSP